MTPWFAAAVGMLIAATLALASPRHAVLSYGPADPGVPCLHLGCATIAPKHGSGSLATAKPVTQLAPPATHAASTPARSAPAKAAAPPAADVTVRFSVLRHGHGGFVGVITVQSRSKLGDWSLQFTIPGTRISQVWGADWQPSASRDGGVASGRQGPTAQSAAGMAEIVISAAGRPTRPTGCIFDGQRCVFG